MEVCDRFILDPTDTRMGPEQLCKQCKCTKLQHTSKPAKPFVPSQIQKQGSQPLQKVVTLVQQNSIQAQQNPMVNSEPNKIRAPPVEPVVNKQASIEIKQPEVNQGTSIKDRIRQLELAKQQQQQQQQNNMTPVRISIGSDQPRQLAPAIKKANSDIIEDSPKKEQPPIKQEINDQQPKQTLQSVGPQQVQANSDQKQLKPTITMCDSINDESYNKKAIPNNRDKPTVAEIPQHIAVNHPQQQNNPQIITPPKIISPAINVNKPLPTIDEIKANQLPQPTILKPESKVQDKQNTLKQQEEVRGRVKTFETKGFLPFGMGPNPNIRSKSTNNTESASDILEQINQRPAPKAIHKRTRQDEQFE